MGASVPFSLGHVLDAVVEACVQELIASRQELAGVRAAASSALADIEGERAELERQLAERDAELERVRGELLALQEAKLPPAPARLATAAELAEPPKNPRLSGHTTLVGLTFGTWKVVDRAGGGLGLSYWKCVCIKCGARREIAGVGAFSLRGNKLPWCPTCRSARKGAKPPVTGGDHEDPEDET